MRGSSSSNTRWCPTPEQVMVLEELYRRGLRTPNAPQIQKITAHLSLYGNIQGKNVFYWFQNHKARDRQKLRKQHHLRLLHHYHHRPAAYPFHFQIPPSSSPSSPHNIPFQGEEVAGVMRQQQTWRRWSDDHPDPPKDCLMRGTYGQDSVMIMDVGPTSTTLQFQPPLETLELFPLSASPTAAADHLHQS